MSKTTRTLSLDTETDKDILRWLNRQDNRSAAIRVAIRDHIGRNGVTLGDVFRAVKEIERKIQTGGVLTTNDPSLDDDWDEPQEAAAALDALANL